VNSERVNSERVQRVRSFRSKHSYICGRPLRNAKKGRRVICNQASLLLLVSVVEIAACCLGLQAHTCPRTCS